MILIRRNANYETTEYVVQKGDSLYSISQVYNTTVAELIKLNNLNNTIIIEGQMISVPVKEGPTITSYVIKDGDTVSSVFEKLQLEYDYLNQYPGLLELKLVPGQEITVGMIREETLKQKLERILIENNITSDQLILMNPNWIGKDFRTR